MNKEINQKLCSRCKKNPRYSTSGYCRKCHKEYMDNYFHSDYYHKKKVEKQVKLHKHLKLMGMGKKEIKRMLKIGGPDGVTVANRGRS